MIDETVNYKQSITALRKQINVSGRKAKELDAILDEIDAPLWSISLNVDLLKKINRTVELTEKKAGSELDRLLVEIGEV